MLCPICRTSETETILEKENLPVFSSLKPKPYSEERRFDAVLLRCLSCGYVSQKLTSELEMFLTDFYTKEESFFTTPPTQEKPGPRVVQTIEYLKSFVSNPVESVLEIGAYDGFFLEQVRKAFSSTRTIGIEISSTHNTYKDITLIHDVYPSTQVEGDTFDLIVCMNVLEHIFTPREFMERIGKNLSETGHVLIEIPNEEYAFSIGAPSFHHQHISYFTPKTIERFLSSVGFQIDGMYTQDLDRMLIVCSKQKNEQESTVTDLSASGYALRLEQAILRFESEIQSGPTGLYGACTLTNNMIAFTKGDLSSLKVYDGDERKWNHYMSDVPTPIQGWKKIDSAELKKVLIMPHSFSTEIMAFLAGQNLQTQIHQLWD